MDAGDEGARRGSAAAHAAAARARRESGIGVGDLTMPAFSALATPRMAGVASGSLRALTVSFSI